MSPDDVFACRKCRKRRTRRQIALMATACECGSNRFVLAADLDDADKAVKEIIASHKRGGRNAGTGRGH